MGGIATLLGGCNRTPESTTGQPPVNAEGSANPTAVTNIKPEGKLQPAAPAVADIWKQFSGDKAFAEVRKQVEVGPRPAGSPELEKARGLIEDSLHRSGWEVERQVFSGDTPRGPLEFINLIARFSATGAKPVPHNTQKAIVCSHYDTKRYSTIQFVGASDGASSTGALLELARVLALDPTLASKIELVFFDGEEAVRDFTSPLDPNADGLYGSRHYAAQLRAGDRHKQFQFGILWDMIGDRDLTITLPPDSPSNLSRDILAAADALQVRKNFSFLDRNILDDHEPLNRVAKIPTIDLIDFDYPFWHTADDTLDKIAPESLQTVGAVTLFQLRKALGK